MKVSLTGATFLGGYRVLYPIAKGAVATVYLVFDHRGHPYALKVFPRNHKGRAQREWEVGRRLSHPRINAVLARLEVEGYPSVLMALAPGLRLSQWREAHPDEDFLPLFGQLLEALAHLHERGLVHRDVKPENFIVASPTQAKLIDFDLAGPVGEPLGRVRVGTPAFLSPEELDGHPPTPASDIYAAGMILYWGVSGELPLHGQAISPGLFPDGRPELASFLKRMLAPTIKTRFQDALEALEVFTALANQDRGLPPFPERK